LDAAAVEALLGKLFDEDDLGRNENGGLAGLVGGGDFDERLRVVRFAAFEAQAAFGHVLALDDLIAALWMADTGGVVDLDAGVFAAIDARGGGLLWCGQGEHGRSGLSDKFGAGKMIGALRGGQGLRQLKRRGVERRRRGRRSGNVRGRLVGRGI